MNPGEYNRLYAWMQQTTTQDESTSSPVESWSNSGFLWGTYEALRSNEMLAMSMKAVESYVKIRIRNLPAIKFVDRLLDMETVDTLLIDSLLEDKAHNQLILICHRFGERNV